MKRFYREVTVRQTPEAGGYAVLLDGKPLFTPARHAMILPNAALAEAVAQEWRDQGEIIDKTSLRLTGFAALTLDVLPRERQAAIEELLEYGETDLLLYRDSSGSALADLQQRHWQPWVEKAQALYGTSYHIVEGIAPHSQPVENARRYQAALDKLNNHQLSILAVTAKISTSLILALCFLARKLNFDEFIHLSHLEESFNESRWGRDAEISAKVELLQQELRAAQRWRDLLDCPESSC